MSSVGGAQVKQTVELQVRQLGIRLLHEVQLTARTVYIVVTAVAPVPVVIE